MLKKLYGLSDSGQRAMYRAAARLTVFELAAALPAVLMLYALKEMLSSVTSSDRVSAVKYIIIGILLIVLMYMSYRKMYRTKYLEAGKENSTMRMQLAERLRLLPEEFLSRHDLRDLTSAIMDDMATVEGALVNQVAETISGVVSGIVILIVLAFVNLKLTLCLAACLPLAALAMALSKAVSGKTHEKNRKAKLKISEGVQEYLENIKVLQHSESLESYQEKVGGRIKKLLPGLILFEFLAGGCVAAAYNIVRMGIAFVTVTGADMLVKGEITPLVFLTFLIMSVWVYEPLSNANESLGALIASTLAAGRLRHIRVYPLQRGDEALANDGCDIRFEDVCFSYDSKETIKNVSFTAEQGKYTALVGASGSGKSTVCRLAARLRDIDSGRITIGGQDISRIPPEELFSLFSIVFQDVTLFNDSAGDRQRTAATADVKRNASVGNVYILSRALDYLPGKLPAAVVGIPVLTNFQPERAQSRHCRTRSKQARDRHLRFSELLSAQHRSTRPESQGSRSYCKPHDHSVRHPVLVISAHIFFLPTSFFRKHAKPGLRRVVIGLYRRKTRRFQSPFDLICGIAFHSINDLLEFQTRLVCAVRLVDDHENSTLFQYPRDLCEAFFEILPEIDGLKRCCEVVEIIFKRERGNVTLNDRTSSRFDHCLVVLFRRFNGKLGVIQRRHLRRRILFKQRTRISPASTAKLDYHFGARPFQVNKPPIRHFRVSAVHTVQHHLPENALGLSCLTNVILE